jgi:hypothetical protein
MSKQSSFGGAERRWPSDAMRDLLDGLRGIEQEHIEKGAARNANDVREQAIRCFQAMEACFKELENLGLRPASDVGLPLPAPLYILAFELAELCDGRSSSLFNPPNSAKQMRAPNSRQANYVQRVHRAEAVAMVDVLHEDGMFIDAAYEKIAGMLHKAGFASGRDPYTPDAIKKWRQQIHRGRPHERKLYLGALQVLRDELAELTRKHRGANDRPDDVRNHMLDISAERIRALAWQK